MNLRPINYRESRMNKYSFYVASATAVAGLWPVACNAILKPATATGPGPAYQNTSTLAPNIINPANGNNAPFFFTGQCPWITSTMNAFVRAKTTATTKWTWSWAVPTFSLKADLTVSDYYAWVVNSPNLANGFALAGGVRNKDAGGADFGLTYNQAGAAGSPANVFFVQSYIDAVGTPPATSTKLDNGGKATPWYGGASSQTGAVSKMGDEPYDSAPGPAVVQFQTAIATDAVTVTGGITRNVVTVYQGEEWWGYAYRAVRLPPAPVPEASTYIAGALMLAPFGTSALRKLRTLRKSA
jgi:hypothetical protein